MKRISIPGAGWLGAPLAIRLKDNGNPVKVSTTTAEKAASFAAQGIPAYLIRIGAATDKAALTELLRDTDVLIITVPPGRNPQHTDSDYLTNIRSVLPFIIEQGIREVIFTRSTVYLSLRGTVDEDTPIRPVSDADRQIAGIENMLLEHPGFNATILRPGALIGEDRHPVHYIVKRPVVDDANNPVNMIHRNDILRFIERMVTTGLPNERFNLVAPISSNRKDFYTREAQYPGLTSLPQFTDNPDADMRRVNGGKIAQRYGLDYKWHGQPEAQ